MSLRNPAWKLANRSKPAEGSGHIERLFFAKAKQMDGIGDDKYWRKCLPGKLPKYGHDKKSHEALQEIKGTLHVALRSGLHRSWRCGKVCLNEVYQQNRYFEYCQLETVGHVLKKCHLRSVGLVLLRKLFP